MFLVAVVFLRDFNLKPQLTVVSQRATHIDAAYIIKFRAIWKLLQMFSNSNTD